MLRTFEWDVNSGAAQDTEPSVNVVQFGDGYDQASSWGINNIRDGWQLTRTDERTTIEQIRTFLKDHKGVTPFYVVIDGEKGTYRTQGGFGKKHVGHNVWSISFELKQVFTP